MTSHGRRREGRVRGISESEESIDENLRVSLRKGQTCRKGEGEGKEEESGRMVGAEGMAHALGGRRNPLAQQF